MADDVHSDLLGNPLTEAETALLQAYRHLEELVARTDLPPNAAAAAREALASLWQAVHAMALTDDRTLA